MYARTLFGWSHFRGLIRPPTTSWPTAARVRDDNAGLWACLTRILRIVDGDTLDVIVDAGLGHRPFLRLRGIDTAELYTPPR